MTFVSLITTIVKKKIFLKKKKTFLKKKNEKKSNTYVWNFFGYMHPNAESNIEVPFKFIELYSPVEFCVCNLSYVYVRVSSFSPVRSNVCLRICYLLILGKCECFPRRKNRKLIPWTVYKRQSFYFISYVESNNYEKK